MIFTLAFWLFYTLPKLLLSWLQIRHIERFSRATPIILEEKEYKEAAAYAKSKERLAMVETLLEGALFGIWLYGGLFWLEQNLGETEPLWLGSLLFVLGFVILGSLVSLPLEAYKKLILDRRFGFAKGDAKLFILDQLKSLALWLLLGSPILLALLWILKNLEDWWLYGWGLVMGILLLANLFYPTLIAPLFNRFTPLEDASLQEKIDELLHRAGFKSQGVFVMDASRRDGRLNAYFGGLGKSKRVVLFDTLLQKVGERELLAILGHELGHFRHGDLYKNLAFSAFLLLLLFYVAGHLPSSLFEAASIEASAHATLALLLLVASPLSFWLMPLFGILSRHNEYEADRFGAEMEDAKALSSALVALVNENRSFPYSHPAFIFFYYTHPPLLQRLEALGYFHDH